MGYLREGRRREKRMSESGPAWLESEGKSGQAEVPNVSSGRMQIFLHNPLKSGNSARIKGVKTERIALIRGCTEVAGGYHVGLQFFGDNAPPARWAPSTRYHLSL